MMTDRCIHNMKHERVENDEREQGLGTGKMGRKTDDCFFSILLHGDIYTFTLNVTLNFLSKDFFFHVGCGVKNSFNASAHV